MLWRKEIKIDGCYSDIKIETSLKKLISLLSKKYKGESDVLSRVLNSNIALFMRDLLYIMNRDFIFDMISLYLMKLSSFPENSRTISGNRFVFLELIFDHDQLLPLSRGCVLNESCDAKHYFNSFNKKLDKLDPELPKVTFENMTRQFFPRLLLCEVMLCFTRKNPSFVLERAAYTLRKLLTKHDFDRNYQCKMTRYLIAVSYIDFLPDI